MRKKFVLTLLFASMPRCFPWLSVASDASVAPEIKELQDKDTGVVLKVWSEGNCEKFGVQEFVPGSDEHRINVKYDISTKCEVLNFKVQKLPKSQSKNNIKGISKASDSCKTVYSEQMLKDPVNLVISKLTTSSVMCWNGHTSYFSAPRSAEATAPLAWNHVIEKAKFTSIDDSYGAFATVTARAKFRTDFVPCKSPNNTYYMTNSMSSSPNGQYSTGFSNDLRCVPFLVHVDSNHDSY